MTDLIKKDCDHFWAHDHMGYAKNCIKCGKMVRMSFRSDSFIVRKIEEDNVTDIENHISPSTVRIDYCNHEPTMLNDNLFLVLLTCPPQYKCRHCGTNYFQ